MADKNDAYYMEKAQRLNAMNRTFIEIKLFQLKPDKLDKLKRMVKEMSRVVRKSQKVKISHLLS